MELVSRHEKPNQQLLFFVIFESAVKIDRYAWYRGYTAMNLAKAAPVWKQRGHV